MGKTKISDISSTRRSVPFVKYVRDSALYATYNVIGYEDLSGPNGAPRAVVLERKPEFLNVNRKVAA